MLVKGQLKRNERNSKKVYDFYLRNALQIL